MTHIRHGVEFVHEATDVSVSLNKQIAGSYTVQVQAWDADGNNYPTANITVIGKTATEVTVRGVEGPFVETHVSVIAIPA
ncbi:MAG: hypothetical protein K9J21_10490 [Bacteroidales bacterium]|nr:hypothetical protein [Bacteroidales bacterium]